MSLLPDILATGMDNDVDSDYDEPEADIVEDVHPASEPSHHLESDHDESPPVAVTRDNRKRQAQRTASSPSIAKTRKSDSATLLKDKRMSSRASVGEANVARRYKASSKGSIPRKSTGSLGKVSAGRKEDSIRFLSAERKRLEKENEEKKRRLEELKKQDMLIEVAAKKGGPYEKQLAEVNLRSAKRSKFFAHKDLAGNIFASMDKDLSASSDEEEGNIEDEQPAELEDDESKNVSILQAEELASNGSGNISDASISEDDVDAKDEKDDAASNAASDNESDAGDDNVDNASDVSAADSEHEAERSGNKSDSVEDRDLSDGGNRSEKSHSSQKRPLDTSRREISNTEKLLRYIFLDAKFYLIKSGNYENIALAQAKGVWSSPPPTESRLNRAFRSSSNVILVFSVTESRRFQGFARLATESDKNHPPIRWVLPAGMPARSLSGVFTLDWINRNELDFKATMSLKNSWNENYSVRVGRDGQAIEPVVGEAVCRLFPSDDPIDLHAIALKSREAMDKRGLNPHKLYKRAELKRWLSLTLGQFSQFITGMFVLLPHSTDAVKDSPSVHCVQCVHVSDHS